MVRLGLACLGVNLGKQRGDLIRSFGWQRGERSAGLLHQIANTADGQFARNL